MKEGILHDINRFRRDIIPALEERASTDRTPPSVERSLTLESGVLLAESLVNFDTRQKLFDLSSSLSDGSYLARDVVGMPEKATRHAHDFVTDRYGDSTRFFFIDPEHGMGKNKNNSFLGLPRRGDMRPKVNIMQVVELTSSGEIETICILRYRSSAIPTEQPRLNSNGEQLKMARLMCESGELPEVLQGQENEITFRLDLRRAEDGYKVIAQARQARDEVAVEKMIDDLITGTEMPSSDPLEGQLERFRSVMRTHFPKKLEEGNFKKI